MTSSSLSNYKGSDEIANHDCDVCLSNSKTSEGISYCTNCCEYMCQACDMAHNTFKATKNHKVLLGLDMPSTRTKQTLPFMFCDTHKTTLLDVYCTTHDNVICPACKMTNHKKCDTGDVTKHSTRINVEMEFKKVEKCLKDLSTRYDDLAKQRLVDKSNLKSQTQKCLSDMHQLRKDINDKFDELEKKMASEIHNVEETMIKDIEGHVTLSNDVLHQIEDLNKYLSECKKTRENDVIFVGIKKATSQASEYGRIIDNVQKDIYPIDIRFRPNDGITDMIQQVQSLGTVGNKRPPNLAGGIYLYSVTLRRPPILRL